MYTHPPHGGSFEILGGGSGLKRPNNVKLSINLNWNFQVGGGVQTNEPSGVGGGGGVEYGYFLKQFATATFHTALNITQIVFTNQLVLKYSLFLAC